MEKNKTVKTTLEINELSKDALDFIKFSIGIPNTKLMDDALRGYLFDGLSDDELINRENIRTMLKNRGF